MGGRFIQRCGLEALTFGLAQWRGRVALAGAQGRNRVRIQSAQALQRAQHDRAHIVRAHDP